MINTTNYKKIFGSLISIIIVVTFFILASMFAKNYENEIRTFVALDGVFGMVVYILITAIAIVIAPISTLPLIPIATNLWGWSVAGALSIVGWTIGAQIAFVLARHLGKPFIKKIISIEKLNSFEDRIPKSNLFWTVVFLRMTVPVDILSYALGLFSQMRSWPYFWSTLIGITPFAFVFAYVGKLPVGFQIITFIEIAAVVVVVYLIRKHKNL